MPTGKVLGVNGTIQDLLALETVATKAEAIEIMNTAKSAAAALRAGVPNPALSNMEVGPIRAHVERSSGGRYYGQPNSHRLGSVHLTGPVMAVISDMAMITRAASGTLVPNLSAKFGRASRFVWPTVTRFTAGFKADIVVANGKAAVLINRRLKQVRN